MESQLPRLGYRGRSAYRRCHSFTPEPLWIVRGFFQLNGILLMLSMMIASFFAIAVTALAPPSRLLSLFPIASSDSSPKPSKTAWKPIPKLAGFNPQADNLFDLHLAAAAHPARRDGSLSSSSATRAARSCPRSLLRQRSCDCGNCATSHSVSWSALASCNSQSLRRSSARAFWTSCKSSDVGKSLGGSSDTIMACSRGSNPRAICI